MDVKPFRQQWKEPLQIKVPVELVDRLRTKAARARRSISEVVCEAVALGLGIDPTDYGIEVLSPNEREKA